MKQTLKSIVLLLIIALLFATIPSDFLTATATTVEFAGGSGTQEDPYLIATKEHLNNVRNHLNAHHKMIADIEFTDADFANDGLFYNKGQGWSPIGTDYSSPFTGIFDGNSHKITNLYINSTLTPDNYQICAGLFGYGDGCQISNLTLVNTSISVTAPYAAVSAGSFLGYTDEFGSGASITNCISNGKIYVSHGNVGGIAGSFEKGTISACTNYCSIDSSSADAGGIICSLSQGDISDCYNYGDIGLETTSTGRCGGIVSSTFGTITSCANFGNVISLFESGGIAGSSNDTISNCENTGTITAKYSAGGIACIGAIIKNCTNNGSVTAGIKSDDMYGIHAGGIAGSIHEGGRIIESWNYSAVLSQAELVVDCDAGGIVGYNTGGFVIKCGNAGPVTVKTERYASGGGIVGSNYGAETSILIDQCINQGPVYSPIGDGGICGGITGSNYDAVTISNCYNIGAVTSSSRPGGIIGSSYNGNVTIDKCYNIGILTTLTPNSWIEGDTTANLSNCFYLSQRNYSSTIITGFSAGTPLPPTEMATASSFTNFNFNSIWTMAGNDDYPYPELQAVELPYSKTLQNITIYQLPNKTTYREGEESLDVTGGKLLLFYNCGVQEVIDITTDMISGYDNAKLGPQTLTLAYGGKSTAFSILIKGFLGDVDNNGAINSTDARLVLQYAVNKIDSTALNVTVADVNDDGIVNSTDARLILQYAVKKIDSF